MRRDIKAERGSTCDAVHAGGKVVPAVDAGEHRVVAGLDADFQLDDVLARQLRQIGQHLGCQAIGPRANRQAADLRVRQRFLVQGAQALEFAVGVAVALEVGNVTIRAGVAPFQKIKPGVDLRSDALLAVQVTGREAVVVAKGAAAATHQTVAVRAGEAGLDRDLLHPPAVARFHMLVPGAVAAWPERAFGVFSHARSYQFFE